MPSEFEQNRPPLGCSQEWLRLCGQRLTPTHSKYAETPAVMCQNGGSEDSPCVPESPQNSCTKRFHGTYWQLAAKPQCHTFWRLSHRDRQYKFQSADMAIQVPQALLRTPASAS